MHYHRQLSAHHGRAKGCLAHHHHRIGRRTDSGRNRRYRHLGQYYRFALCSRRDTSLNPELLGSCICSSRDPEVVRHTIALAYWVCGHRAWGKLSQLGRALPGSHHDHDKPRIPSLQRLSRRRREEWPMILGSTSSLLRGGQSSTVHTLLSPVGIALLSHRGKLIVSIAVTITVPGGPPVMRSRTFVPTIERAET
jgi:hypothetical protein